VGDVDEGDADVVLDRLQLELHLLAQLQVERAQRLVEEEHPRLVHERPRERDALLLAARELPRLAPFHPLEADEVEDVEHAPAEVALADALAAQAEGDVLEDAQVREERVRLEDRVHVALVRRPPADRLVAEVDRPVRRFLEAADHPQRRRLAAAGRAEQREEAAALDLEGEVVDGSHVVEALRHVVEADVRNRRRSRGVRLLGDGHQPTLARTPLRAPAPQS
jgi:hypothetical protein